MTTEENRRGAVRAVAQLGIGAVEAIRRIERQLGCECDAETLAADLEELRIDLELLVRLATEAASDSSICVHCGTVVT